MISEITEDGCCPCFASTGDNKESMTKEICVVFHLAAAVSVLLILNVPIKRAGET
jgi:hypothetical protein